MFTGSPSGGWNVSSSAVSTDAVATSIGPSSLSSVTRTTLNIYSTHSTISLSSYAAQSGFYSFPTPSAIDPALSSVATLSPHSSADGTVSSELPIYTSPLPPLFTNITSGLPNSATVPSVISSIGVHSSLIPSTYAHQTEYPPSHPSSVNTISGPTSSSLRVTLSSQLTHSTICLNSTTLTSAASSATSSSSGLLALGSPCTSSSQCANGASCYATNFMLQLVCGNFQASCTSNSQCAFNSCNSGFW